LILWFGLNAGLLSGKSEGIKWYLAFGIEVIRIQERPRRLVGIGNKELVRYLRDDFGPFTG
jgi:hypothetical protein